ncbi:hypothetical protein BCL57_001906 [Agromyces flavus]|uniref:Uncharacterized protein n=1 Tax=Agromyces flavus TaxID=589382 RepID=A0A1H1QF28_9MICO|nr:hypothetical protein [Agromyces flavus]MCP2367747.1 hypothetical protein [Agromyces flavus]GGI47206.1 hypothetical protein GCM10010932_18940 [Agromyces flavus]SDS22026.1 hypothetical protein SAMN04489721_0962 [Agromyces flavus]
MADAPGPDPSPPDSGDALGADGLTDAQKSLRAQLLATEHWSLLASRSTTQGEVLTRIAIFLTVVSAGLIGLGILGNATQFRGWFGVAALGVLFLLLLLGLITMLRAFNTATEDLMYVLAMNRLRAAYLDLDPGLEPYLMMSPFDDMRGSEVTYHVFFPRPATQILGSSMMIISVVTSTVAGLLAGGVAASFDAPVGVCVAVGVVVGMGALVWMLRRGYDLYRRVWREHTPLRPTPPTA